MPRPSRAVRSEAWPSAETADELHDALMLLGILEPECDGGAKLAAAFAALVRERRATVLSAPGRSFWVAAEQLPMIRALYAPSVETPSLEVPADYASRGWEPDDALRELLRGRLQAIGPTSVPALARVLAQPPAAIDAALYALEAEGFVMRGHFTPGGQQLEWCERRLLARIHRYTIKSLRAEIEPVSSGDFMRFLLDWQGVTAQPRPQGAPSLERIVEQLEGFEIPAVAWESDVLPARLRDYDGAWLDSLCLSGRAFWARLDPPQSASSAPVRATPMALLTRKHRAWWQRFSQAHRAQPVTQLSANARAMAEFLQCHGASFFDEMVQGAGLLPVQAEGALGELVAAGLASADSFAGLRALLLPMQRKRAARGRRAGQFGLAEAGRWSLVRRAMTPPMATRGAAGRASARDGEARCRRCGPGARGAGLGAAAPLWRGVPAPAGTRSRLAAAVASAVARLSSSRGPGPDPRRPLRRRHER